MPDRCVEEVKKTCSSTSGPSLVQTLSLEDVVGKLNAATAAGDWHGLLALEGRMEELLESRPDPSNCETILAIFAEAHKKMCFESTSTEHAEKVIKLLSRREQLLGKLQRFRDQGENLHSIADHLLLLPNRQLEAANYLKRTRSIGAEHGFFGLEALACMGIGQLALKTGNVGAGLEALRQALTAADFDEFEDAEYAGGSTIKVNVLRDLTSVLIGRNAIDEAEPLVARFREEAKAESARKGGVCFSELFSLFANARLLEARKKPREAAAEFCSLLDVLHNNEIRAIPGMMPRYCEEMLGAAGETLKILDPKSGEKDLIAGVAAARLKVARVQANQ
mmetsp:Transcript_35393/g.80539  ORF Transcript_35393/g.80539 Transcript_35393/m.80539 type:complete len:336 (+) Transcript_35393:207-1214(+)